MPHKVVITDYYYPNLNEERKSLPIQGLKSLIAMVNVNQKTM
jgi:hypothetical protein